MAKKKGKPTYRELELTSKARIKELEDDLRIAKHIIAKLVRGFSQINQVMSAHTEEALMAARYVQ